jgi:hypothetical protein
MHVCACVQTFVREGLCVPKKDVCVWCVLPCLSVHVCACMNVCEYMCVCVCVCVHVDRHREENTFTLP